MFSDGYVQQYGAEVISDNIFSQVDGDDCIYNILKSIIYHHIAGI